MNDARFWPPSRGEWQEKMYTNNNFVHYLSHFMSFSVNQKSVALLIFCFLFFLYRDNNRTVEEQVSYFLRGKILSDPRCTGPWKSTQVIDVCCTSISYVLSSLQVEMFRDRCPVSWFFRGCRPLLAVIISKVKQIHYFFIWTPVLYLLHVYLLIFYFMIVLL